LVYGFTVGIDWTGIGTRMSFSEFIAVLEPTFGTSVWVGAFWVFTWSLETRWKHRRILEAISELRSLIHVVDMHQLTKDPERARRPGPDTPSSPTRQMSPFELGRYLDYCSELLSTISKVAALYAQAFPDAVILSATDQVETLAAGLSRKIWQKLVLLGEGRTEGGDSYQPVAPRRPLTVERMAASQRCSKVARSSSGPHQSSLLKYQSQVICKPSLGLCTGVHPRSASILVGSIA
jgi:hypothetical protein